MKASRLLFALVVFDVACGAVYPELTSPVKAPPPGRALVPPPPKNLVFITFVGATIPSKTRDGRKWDSLGGSAPDPVALLFVDGKELIRTPIQSNTLNPSWPGQHRDNYRLPASGRYRVELWDNNPLNDRPICIKNLHDLLDDVGGEPVEVECDSGAHVTLKVEPAHPRWGLGFSYELRTQGIGGVAVTHTLEESPAARVGIQPGDEIVEIKGKNVLRMDSGEAQSLINANAGVGVDMQLRGAGGASRRVTVKEGVIYPVAGEGVPVE